MLLLGAGAAQGCNRPGCNGQLYHAGASNPVISSMKLVNQLPTDPWTAIFSVTFQDQAADLGSGQALIYFDGNSSPVSLSLADVLQSSNVDANATSGIFAIHLRFAPESVQDGDMLRLGTQLKGGGGGVSNCYEMDLEFAVQPVADALVEKTSLWASHLFDLVCRDLLKSCG